MPSADNRPDLGWHGRIPLPIVVLVPFLALVKAIDVELDGLFRNMRKMSAAEKCPRHFGAGVNL